MRIIENIKINFIAASFLMTTFTTLRIPGISIGVGEIAIFMVSLGIYFLSKKKSQRLKINTIIKFIGYMLLQNIAALIIGIMLLKLEYDFHTYMAYIFIFITVLLFSQESYKILFYSFKRLPILSIIFLPMIYFNQFYYAGVRFRGLSKNPNQLGLFLVITSMMAIFNFNKKKNKFNFFIIILNIYIGIKTQSDAYILSCFIGSCAYIFTMLKNRIKKFIPFIISGVLIYGIVKIKDYYHYVDNDGGQASLRMRLWILGIKNTMETSFLWGIGPRFITTHKGYGMGTFESHNTFIDLFTQLGIVGLVIFLFLLITIIKRNRIIEDKVLLGSVIIFSQFHFIFRQPIFWLLLLLLEMKRRKRNG